MQILDLPDVVIEEIFSYLAFDEVAKLRIVSRIENVLKFILIFYFQFKDL